MKRYRFGLLLLILMSLLLSACSQRVDMTFYKNGEWLVKSATTYTNAITDLTGDLLGIAGIDIGGGSGLTNLTKSATTAMFNIAKNVFREMGIKMDWSQKQSGDDTTISIETRADSISKFNLFISSIGESQLREYPDGNYHLQLDFQAMNQQMYDLLGLGDAAPFMDMINLLNDYELRIQTGKVISSNADEIKGRTAIWYNPQYVDIVFRPVGSFNLGVLFILLIIIAAVIGIVVLIGRTQRKSRNDDHFGDYSASSDSDSFFSA